MSDKDDLRRHIEFKRDGERSLPQKIAAHMLEALDRSEATPDYQLLLTAANWPEPPHYVYHTAQTEDREAIWRDGLHVSQPGDGRNAWSDPSGIWASQPVGVYVCEEPDVSGKWARAMRWDVWRVDVTDLNWSPDLLNPRCWIIDVDIEPWRIHLADAREITEPTVGTVSVDYKTGERLD